MKRFILIFLVVPLFLNAQNNEESKMQWFKDAKLGIFIHWGLYAVDGISESWSFYNGYISHEDYLKQTNGFTASEYNPKAWAKLIKESGAKYAVITSKHHDGFALWDSKDGVFNAVKHSAAKKDVLSPFIKNLKKQDLKVGVYYSLPDWSYNDYTHHTKEIKRYKISDEPERWKTFLNYYQSQLKDLKSKYDPDLWWFDGDWEHNAEEWDIEGTRELLFKDRPNVILNSRLCGNGDYATPENGPPVLKPHAKYWELCLTMNDSWGYQEIDQNYKSTQQILDIFTDCLHMGGNLLLDIAPKADGSIPDIQKNILKEIGRWNKKHAEAIYGSEAGIPKEYFNGPSTLSKDKRTLYLFVRDIPKDGKIILKGVKNKINRIYIVGNGTVVPSKVYSKIYWSQYPGIHYIELPKNTLDQYYTVLAVMLDGEIELYRDHHGAVESN
ncbi:MAG: alpha-L-fucosidase [Bacteroidetes bacterium]|nr:alpha-L-fucosidase [Bacteroidota bacterium]